MFDVVSSIIFLYFITIEKVWIIKILHANQYIKEINAGNLPQKIILIDTIQFVKIKSFSLVKLCQ